ncbi:MAG: DNA repair exonuclease [Pseudomonadales bacterium]
MIKTSAKTSLRVLHTSDIHLDNYAGAGEPMNAGESGFRTVIDKALELEVDLFLLAGDLFEHNRVKDHCLEFASKQLARLNCPVVMITGNHDCLADYSVYHRYDPTLAGDHIHFIRAEEGGVASFPDLGVNVWGKGIVDHYPGNKPLEAVPDHQEASWYIGVTHGYYVDCGAEMFSSLITPEEISRSKLDYLALGHVHRYQSMRHGKTLAAYSGSPNLDQGVSDMTAAYVEFCPDNGVTVEKVTLQSE